VVVVTKLLTAKLHSLYVKEPGVGNFEKVAVGPQPWWYCTNHCLVFA